MASEFLNEQGKLEFEKKTSSHSASVSLVTGTLTLPDNSPHSSCKGSSHRHPQGDSTQTGQAPSPPTGQSPPFPGRLPGSPRSAGGYTCPTLLGKLASSRSTGVS